MSATDPSGFITNPPSTYVKIVNTSREEMNGRFGLIISYSSDRNRYLLFFCDNGSQGMLKPENLVKTSTIETYQAQFQQLRNDPRVKQEIARFYNLAQEKLGGMKPEYAAAGIGVLLLLLTMMIGFTKMVLLTSLLMLVGVIIAPDVLANVMNTNNRNWKIVATNFPRRCRETLERNLPAARGKVTDKMAAGIVVFVVFMSLRVLLTSSASSPSLPSPTKTTASPPRSTVSSSASALEQAYKLGYDDATANEPYGTSSLASLQTPSRSFDEIDYDYIPPAAQQRKAKGSGFGIGTIFSMVMVGRTLMQLGTNPVNGGFDIQLAIANFQTLPVWQQGMMGLSLYKIINAFL